jgi:hypothetical protein
VPDYHRGFSPLGQPKDSWLAAVLHCLTPIPANIGRWPARYLIALGAVVALAYVAVQVLAAREALGPVVTLVGVLGAALPIAVIGVIALVKDETTEQRAEEPPQP